MKKIIKNFSYTIFSNLSTTLVSTLVIFILPKLVNSYEYGLFQIFLFYVSYAGLAQLGWLDGLYVRYGGSYYEKLEKPLFKGQFVLYSVLQIIAFFVIIIYSSLFLTDGYKYIGMAVAFGILFTNLKGFFQFILQLTNRIIEFAISNIITTLAYATLMILLLLLGNYNIHGFIWSNIIGQIIALIYGSYKCKSLFFSKGSISLNYHEALRNIYVGSKISIASISAMLILGVVRIGVQTQWSVSTFGKVSLILSVCNLLMIFINAASLVLFPLIKRMNNSSDELLFNSTEEIIMPVLLLLLLLYYPANLFIGFWLPTYKKSIIFMAFLFPLGLYQGKFEVLTNTFFKAWRMENELLITNLVALVSSAIFTLLFAVCMHNLYLTILSITFSMMIRSFITEVYVKKHLSNHSWLFFIQEFLMVLIFILSNIVFNVYIAFITYTAFLVAFFLLKKKKIKASLCHLGKIDIEKNM